jgi:hypothetical protein
MGNDLRRLKGAIHLHTDLSHDGILSIEALVEFLKSKGYDFIAITEHSYDVDDGSMLSLSEKAASLSTDDFTIIPGIEFRCHHDIDIMGFGVIRTCEYETPRKVIDHIKNCGGVAVWAHPSYRDYPVEKEWLEKLDGAEIWNQIHDTRYMPRDRSIRRYDELRNYDSNLMAYCGLDMHTANNFFFMSTEVKVQNNSLKEILAALKDGSFRTRSRYFNINSNGKMTPLYRSYIWVFNRLIDMAKWLRDLVSNG